MVDLAEFIKEAKPKSDVQKMNSTADLPLFNRGEPHLIRHKEAEWHRLASLLAAQGYTRNEIAEKLGRNPSTVGDILRQDYAKPTILSEIRRIATEDEQVITIVRENVARAVGALAEIINDRAAPKRDRIMAANSILDRRYGKPNQPISRDSGIDLDKLTDEELVKMLPPTVSTGTTP